MLLDHMGDAVVFKATPRKNTDHRRVPRQAGFGRLLRRLGSIAGFHHERPQRYTAEGDRVIVLGDDIFEIRRNGVTACSEDATIATFRDGLIAHILVILDVSPLVEGA